MTSLRRSAATALAALLTAGLVAGSRWTWRANDESAAAIRLSWRSVSAPIEECRRVTPEELAQLPPHMRREEICERRHAPFRLTVEIDGDVVRSTRLEPAGASGDRPLYVFEELRVAPGEHRLAIRFEEVRSGDAVPASLRTLDTSLALGPREIAIVSLGPDGQLALATPHR